MYPLQKTNNGYEFQTIEGVKYDVYFTQLIHAADFITAGGLSPERFYYFGFHRVGPKKKGRQGHDVFIKRTIAITIFQFFIENPEGILIFNYSDSEIRVKAKRKKFKEWFDEYSESTRIQLFQYDFEDKYTVCAIYTRGSHPDFTKVKEAIETLVKNVDSPDFKLV